MHKYTTTTRRRQPAPNATAAPALSDPQRWALGLAEREGWGVEAEARDGTRVQLRQGQPRRALVLFLSPDAGDVAELYPEAA